MTEGGGAGRPVQANQMRAEVLSGRCGAWEAEPRSVADRGAQEEAATHYERAAAMQPAPARSGSLKAALAGIAAWCRS